MPAFLFAANWDDFLKILPFIVVLVVWVINQFAGKLQPPPPRRMPPIKPPAAPPAQQPAPGQQPLQAEIEEFLRQAQALREGRPVPPRQPAAPQPMPGGARRPRPPRRAQQGGAKPPVQAAPGAPPVQTPDRPRETVAQYVAEHIDSSKFTQRASALSNIQNETDDFQKHMQRVFDRGLSKPEGGPPGMFEAAGAAAAAVSAAAATTASAAAAGAETATAPTATHKAASNIAVFLAARNNIRDAIILTEILQRPEHRW